MTLTEGIKAARFGWTIAVLSLIFSSGLGAVIMNELNLRWRVIQHVQTTQPMLEQIEVRTRRLEAQQIENARQIRLITRNQCILLQIQANQQRVLFPEECDPFIGVRDGR